MLKYAGHVFTEIVPGFLYLSSSLPVADKDFLLSYHIRRIVNVSKTIANAYPDIFEYLTIQIEDDKTEDITRYFETCFYFHRQRPFATLVHCECGISRSPSFVIGYLVAHAQMSLKEACTLVLSKKKNVSPNSGFFLQLIDLEESITHKKTTYPLYDFLADQVTKSLCFMYDRDIVYNAVVDSTGNIKAAVDFLLGCNFN
ncbi:hypothetical protein EIN_306280 [Entamoeba invadens IP1]|uniref:protein-tyrosine-phosphatase n=1 Tax=Entamoeba invadens IP1 TaxID=370355 RepID=A0A0A1TYT5_ENTIV|nr:hypothetical protein EIN_306280 [Entamoeba invadens IP1]ELP86712.1 hypothetical protein EIN_306280 [Entamoeba invadens IP1]|eukprot:XP_004186058.1 hypothetical protein EIN_306280 [Entamoeba invadens IP1]